MNFLRCVTVASELQRMYLRFSPTSSADADLDDGLIAAAVAAVVVDVEEEGTGEEATAEDSLHSSRRLTCRRFNM